MKKVLYFTATWCGPCQRIKPVFYELEQTYKDIEFSAIDVDLNKHLAELYNISNMPTFVFLHDDQETNRFSGADKDRLVNFLEALQKL